MICEEPDTNERHAGPGLESSKSADTADSGGSSTCSRLVPSGANSDEPVNATNAAPSESAQRGCGVPVQRLTYLVELWCPKCETWEPFASDRTPEKIRSAAAVFPEYRRLIHGPSGDAEELPVDDWVPVEEREPK
jgi:hypothetical protein